MTVLGQRVPWSSMRLWLSGWHLRGAKMSLPCNFTASEAVKAGWHNPGYAATRCGNRSRFRRSALGIFKPSSNRRARIFSSLNCHQAEAAEAATLNYFPSSLLRAMMVTDASVPGPSLDHRQDPVNLDPRSWKC